MSARMWRGGMAGLALGLLTQPVGAVATTQGSQLAAACAGCHRLDSAQVGIPAIAGRDEHLTVGLMLAYRSGERQSQIMQVVAGALSPAEINEVARYLAEQPAVRP